MLAMASFIKLLLFYFVLKEIKSKYLLKLKLNLFEAKLLK
jgi:hypothetical protein